MTNIFFTLTFSEKFRQLIPLANSNDNQLKFCSTENFTTELQLSSYTHTHNSLSKNLLSIHLNNHTKQQYL